MHTQRLAMDIPLQLTVCALLASTINVKASPDEAENMTLIPGDNETFWDGISAPTILPNVDFVGLGYDPILGNPQSNLYDPGFRQAVILLEYNHGGLTSDGKWLVPDGVQVLQTVSCSYASQSEEVMGSASYQQSLAVDASISWGVPGLVKFSASTEFREVHEATTTYKRTLTSSVARCVLYKAVVNYNYEVYKVTTAFASAVQSLPTTRDDAAYIKFVNAYGTHFATTLYTGAKMVVRSEFESTVWTRLDSEGFNFRASADASFLIFSAGASAGITEEERRLQETFDAARSSYKASYVGSHPPPDGKWETWASMSGENPYPIQYVLSPLTDLFTVRYFPTIDAVVLATKRDLLNATIVTYCNGIPGCGIPPPDRTPIRLNRLNATFLGTIRQSCRPGLSLLSCGFGRRTTDSSGNTADFSRYSIPVSFTSCECKDNSGGVCAQWCSNSAQEFEVVASELKTHVFSVYCPKGKKVLGCHIQPNTTQEVWQWNFPTDDGTGCTCYDYFGAKCYATCASNVFNHEVRSEFGRGLVTVKCSPNNYVLGCGVKPVAGGAVEKWRYHQVASIDSCECYDNGGGSTCYAVCGQFS